MPLARLIAWSRSEGRARGWRGAFAFARLIAWSRSEGMASGWRGAFAFVIEMC